MRDPEFYEASCRVLYAIGLGIILSLYALKAALFRRESSPRRMLVWFLAAVALAVPITWLISPDWNNRDVARISNWVGTPIMVLTVPCLSFFFDYANGRRSKGRWYIRIPLEVLVGVPGWVFGWALIELFVFGWIYI